MSNPILTPVSYSFSDAMSNIMTQAKEPGTVLAKRVGCQQSEISAWKCGNALPSEHWVPKIAMALNADEPSLKAAWDRAVAAKTPRTRKTKKIGTRKIMMPTISPLAPPSLPTATEWTEMLYRMRTLEAVVASQGNTLTLMNRIISKS